MSQDTKHTPAKPSAVTTVSPVLRHHKTALATLGKQRLKVLMWHAFSVRLRISTCWLLPILGALRDQGL